MRIVHRFQAMSRPRRLVVLVSALVLIGGAAFAYWTGTGSGSGTGTSGTGGSVTVNQTSAPSNINPGKAAQTLSGTFTNNSDASVYVTSVTASIASVTKAGGAVGSCTAGDYTLASPTATVNQNIPAGGTSGTWSGPTISFNTSASNQDGCKGATVNFSYAVTSS